MPDASRTIPPFRVAVIGGGVSGLAAAHRLAQIAPHAEAHLFEASSRLGGPLASLQVGGLTLEQGADSFLTRTPWAVDLCRELGLDGELAPTNERHRRALVVHRGRLHPVPEGFVLMRPGSMRAILRSPLLSLPGKLRVLAEPLIPKPLNAGEPSYDESVASFATRRLGREAFERLVQPLLGGIYVADAARLSLAATMPEFLDAERQYGSLWRSRDRGKNGAGADSAVHRMAPGGSSARYGAFLTLRGGMSRLIEALASQLDPQRILLGAPIVEAARSAEKLWFVKSADGVAHGPFEGLIVAASAPAAGRMLHSIDEQLALWLSSIQYASSAVVVLVYERAQVTRELDGFGFVVPEVENRPVIAASFPGVKFPHAGSADLVPVRVFLGGAKRPELLRGSDEELAAVAHGQLQELLGVLGAPIATNVARWPGSMPQYHVGHVQLVDAIEQRVARVDGLELAGNAYRGVGIPQCIHSGRSAAERLAAHLVAAVAQQSV